MISRQPLVPNLIDAIKTATEDRRLLEQPSLEA
jgi:hypothetical protein